ncbi:TetR/AcrR family transcriptional regulator [Streptococcus ratti]|uniref:TetR/AcrR family transcriptional regulator n=2 Tax=Streptococcus TaxID=1301 RepID=A0A7X9QFR2_STRRT|nr:TetR/AcrR family transcriptional regulator [Streptococcus ratti]NMD48443.1 TetR/AcrR family transcriptional regulator [Streptococcus ratti]
MNRKEKANQTKKLIFEVAVTLFNRFGYDNVTISNICEEAGVAKGTFYLYYDSKETIIKESYYQDLDSYLNAVFQETIENSKADYASKITTFLVAELHFATDMGIEITTLAYSFNLREALSKKNSHFQKRTFSALLSKLIEDAKTGDVDKPFIFTALESLVRGLMATWCFSEGNFDLITGGRSAIQDLVQLYIRN